MRFNATTAMRSVVVKDAGIIFKSFLSLMCRKISNARAFSLLASMRVAVAAGSNYL